MSLVITPPLVSMPRLQRRDVEQQHVLDVAAQHAGLDRGADGDDLVGVDRLVRLLAGEALDEILHRGHAGGAADEDDVVEVALARRRRPSSACSNGMRQRSIRSAVISWNFAR